MAHYSIKELEHLSGIKAHTIRMWEQRYCILNPQRTETNIRYYDDQDLKAILNISLLNEHGYKISKIAKMSRQEISELVLNLASCDHHCGAAIGALVLAMIELDEALFDKVFSTSVLQAGVEKTMAQVVYPFMHRIGILWQTGNINPAQEHFVSNLIRQKIIVALDAQVVHNTGDIPRYLLFLPEGELHEIGLLFLNYIIRARRCHALFLGQTLPYGDLRSAVDIYQPHYLCAILTYRPDRDEVQDYINRLSADFPHHTIYLTGFLTENPALVFPENIRRVGTVEEFIEVIDGNCRVGTALAS